MWIFDKASNQIECGGYRSRSVIEQLLFHGTIMDHANDGMRRFAQITVWEKA